MRDILLLTLLAAFLLSAGCAQAPDGSVSTPMSGTVQPSALSEGGADAAAGLRHMNVTFPAHDGARIDAEIADTAPEQERGLMERTHLGQNEGMLFVYGEERPLSFWMFHTRIPLDIVFISADGKVADVQSMEPCIGEDASACPVYRSAVPARWALEVNALFAAKYGITDGDGVRIED